jgi:oxygen-independent coproporphyrinogen-3 oxidase
LSSFSAYIHLPYCIRRCPYCDFNTYAVNSVPEEAYTNALVAEIEGAAKRDHWRGRSIDTIFFGGGTPSLFGPASFARLIDTFRERFGIDANAEITMEANPGSLEGSAAERLNGWREAGINRLSFGAQSFNAKHLETLGRLHSADDTEAALKAARHAGFENLSLDLIFGVPGQTLDEWREDLERALTLGTDHVSAYGLTYEVGTPMTGLRDAGRIIPADEDLEVAMLEAARDALEGAGYHRYEISNFAREGRESRHNLAYWLRHDYLGLGAGAHGFCDTPSGGHRYANVRLPQFYMNRAANDPADSREDVDLDAAMREVVLLGLRLDRGIDGNTFEARFGKTLGQVFTRMPALIAAGMLHEDENRLRLTDQGLLLTDTIISQLCLE